MQIKAGLAANTRADKPIVIADYSDNPGSGAYSDCTALIAALLEAGVKNAAAGALLDPGAVATLAQAGIGAKVSLAIGGKIDASVGGGPLQVTGQVMAISDGRFKFEVVQERRFLRPDLLSANPNVRQLLALNYEGERYVIWGFQKHYA